MSPRPSKLGSYFEYLCDLVGRTYQYSSLLEELHAYSFVDLVPNDDNRAADGRNLREKYLDLGEIRGFRRLSDRTEVLEWTEKPCTFLEMLIGLAYRLEWDLGGGQYERGTDDCFWLLIENLELEWCDNSYYEMAKNDGTVAFKVAQVVNRTYLPSGEGGLFPLKHPKKDQRRVEIWYQMSYWIIENYPLPVL